MAKIWTTAGDRSALLTPSDLPAASGPAAETLPAITIDDARTFQTMEGFGFSLTGGSASLIAAMAPDKRAELLRDLFSPEEGIGISSLRLCLGASDLSPHVWSFDDVPAGQNDFALERFNIEAGDNGDVIKVLKEILDINPDMHVLASPWSPPSWMKSDEILPMVQGSLRPECYDAYARYFVKYVQEMNARGIPIHAVTVQNEPHNYKNEPSMLMYAAEQTVFIRDHLGPALRGAGLATEIFCWDHNCDEPQYPLHVLNDKEANPYVAGVAWHLYLGTEDAIEQVQALHPDKKMWLTEQWTGGNARFEDDLQWHGEHMLIGVPRKGGQLVMEWNLANDPDFRPHTPLGCKNALGAVTIGQDVTRNVGYYIIGHTSKFVRPGSVRIGSDEPPQLPNVAYRTPGGGIALVVANAGGKAQDFVVHCRGEDALVHLDRNTVGTCVWPAPGAAPA